VIARFAEWHGRHDRLARVAQYEIRALPPEHVAEIRQLRHLVTERIEGELARGVRMGIFTVPETHETVRAILSLCIDIARWFSPAGPRTPSELGAMYAELVLRMVTAPGGAADPARLLPVSG